MSTKVKAVVVAAVLLLIGGTAAWRFSGATEGQAPPATHASGGSSHTPPSRAATTAEPGSPDSPTMAATDRVAGQTLLLEGEVADQAGAPVPGATVRVDWVDAAFMIQPGSVPADDAGGFRFAFAGRTAEVHAEAPGFAASDVARVEGNLGETRRLRLELRGPAGTVAGRVLDPAGNPLQGVVVRVGPPDGLGQPGDPLRPRRDPMVTDALGRFSVGGVVPGWAEVLAQTHSFSPWWSRVEVRARETKEIEIRLLEGAVLQGTVRDAVGSPAGGVRVSVAGMRGAAGLSTVSDTDGRYRLEGLAAGRTPVQADGGDRGRASADVDLRAGVEWAWDATLAAGTTLAGRLVDGKGVPIPGWWVTAVRAPLGFGPSGKTRTGEDGKFEIPFLDPRAYEVSFLAEEYGVPSVVLRAMPGAAVLLEVVVPAAAIPSAFFTGTLVDSAGKPVADASLVARSGKASRNAVYDKATGTFEIGPLPAGHYGLQLWSESLGPRDFGLREVGQGQRLDLGTLRVGKPGTAALLFQRGEGGPTGQYARFLLRRRGEDGRWVEGAQGPAEGRKTLVVAPGTYGVVVSGYQTRFTLSPTFEVREGEETRVEVTVLGERVRWVRITGPGEDMAPSSVRLTFRDRDGETVADGYWGAPGRKAPDNVGCPTLSPGEYEAEILTDSGETQHFHLSVGAEDGLRMEAPLQIRLR